MINKFKADLNKLNKITEKTEKEIEEINNLTILIRDFGKLMNTKFPDTKVEKTTTTTDTKADIERRRQEELNNQLLFLETKLKSITGNSAMDRLEKGDIENEIKSIKAELNSTSPVKIPNSLKGLVVTTLIHGKEQTVFTTKSLDRTVVFVQIDGKRYGFYQSTKGTDGKIENHWYPFYGKAQGWVVKDGGGKNWKYNSQASPELQVKLEDAANKLNAEYGNKQFENTPYIHDTSENETNNLIGSHVKDSKQDLLNNNKEEYNRIKKKTAEEGFKQNDAELAALKTNVVPENAESSNDVESPAVESGQKTINTDDPNRYTVEKLKSDLEKVTNKKEYDNFLIDVFTPNIQNMIQDDVTEMTNLMNGKKNSFKNLNDIKIDIKKLEKESQIVSKVDIITPNKSNFSANFTFVVTKVDDNNKVVTIKPLGSEELISLSFDDIANKFDLKETIENLTESSKETLNDEVKDYVNETNDVLDAFLVNKKQTDKIIEGVSSKKIKDTDKDLLDNLDC